MKRLFVAILWAFALLAGAIPHPVAAQQLQAVVATDLTCTDSSAFVDLAGMSLTITRSPGPQAPAVIAVNLEIVTMFIQQAVRVRALMDGISVPTGVAGDGVQVAFLFFEDPDVNLLATAAIGTRGFVFVSGPLSPGVHTVTIQWRVSFKSEFGPVCIHTRSLIVGP